MAVGSSWCEQSGLFLERARSLVQTSIHPCCRGKWSLAGTATARWRVQNLYTTYPISSDSNGRKRGNAREGREGLGVEDPLPLTPLPRVTWANQLSSLLSPL